MLLITYPQHSTAVFAARRLHLWQTARPPRVASSELMNEPFPLQVGDTLDVVGPKGDFNYLGRGEYAIAGARTKAANLGFVCGGSGITPAFQVPCLQTLDCRGTLLIRNQPSLGTYSTKGRGTY